MDDTRFRSAIDAFDRLNAEDPHVLSQGGAPRPRELVHAEWLSEWVERVDPSASEALRLAARCQHLCRWKIPRSSYPEGRTGYLTWRKELARFHADEAERVLRSVRYDEATIAQVRHINLKRALKLDPDTQAMEDALCLSFLEHEFDEFSEAHPDDKVIEILQKTWHKMSARGQALAGTLRLSERSRKLVESALSGAAS